MSKSQPDFDKLTTQDVFEKNVLHYSYEEFLMKLQVYNPEGKWKTFSVAIHYTTRKFYILLQENFSCGEKMMKQRGNLYGQAQR